MYYSLFNLLHEFIYGAGAELTQYQELVLTQLSTIGVLFVVAIPFVVVGLIIWSIVRSFL